MKNLLCSLVIVLAVVSHFPRDDFWASIRLCAIASSLVGVEHLRCQRLATPKSFMF